MCPWTELWPQRAELIPPGKDQRECLGREGHGAGCTRCSSEDILAPSTLPCCCGAGIPSTAACESWICAGGLVVHLCTSTDSTAKQRKIFRLEFAFVTKRFSSDFHALGRFCTNYMCIAIKIATLPFTF